MSAGILWSQPTGFLKVRVVDGDGAFNDIKNEIGHKMTVEVRDRNNRPIVGAEVTFTAPSFGASGTFANGTFSETTLTDRDGLAHSAGLKPNTTEGRFSITVLVRGEGAEGMATIGQANTAAASPKNKEQHDNQKKHEFSSGFQGSIGK